MFHHTFNDYWNRSAGLNKRQFLRSFTAIVVMASIPVSFSCVAAQEREANLKDLISEEMAEIGHEFDRTNRLVRESLMRSRLEGLAYIEKIRLTGPPLGEDYTNDRIEQSGAGAFIRENRLIFWAYVFVPKAYASGDRKLPLLLYPHPGVHSNFQIDNGGHTLRELLAQGYIVAVPDYRGSTGYGENFYKTIDYGGKEIQDTKATRDFLVENYSIVDADRVGIMGHSHGGLHTVMNLFEYPDAYKVGFADVPVSDLIARMGYKTQGYRELYSTDYHIGKTAYEATEEYMRRSPVWNAHKLQTPLLIYTNTNDEDVNALEVRSLIRALQAEGKDFEYEIFEDIPGGHKHARMDHAAGRRARLRAYEFLGQYLSPPNPLESLDELEQAGYLFHGRPSDEAQPDAAVETVSSSEISPLVIAPDRESPRVSVAQSYVEQIDGVAEHEAAAAMEQIESRTDEARGLLIELTEIPAPPFNEERRGRRIAELMRDIGYEDVAIDEVGNVVARRAGSNGEKTVAIAAHMDTVFPPETDVTVRREGERLYAPGIGDNTRGVIALLEIMRAIHDQDIETEASLMFVANVGEEGLGDLKGMKHLFREGGPRIDTFIAIDGDEQARIVQAAVGSHRYRVTFKGPGGHSWGAFGLANPHHALGRAIAIFDSEAPAVSATEVKTSFNVGRIGGGTSVNSIPFESWMEVDMRSSRQHKIDEMDAVFQEAVQKALEAENAGRASGPELTVDVDMVGLRPAGETDPRSPLVQRAMAAVERYGFEPRLVASSTDSNIPMSQGIPAITISRGGTGGNAHSPDEWWQDKDSHVGPQVTLLILLGSAGLTE